MVQRNRPFVFNTKQSRWSPYRDISVKTNNNATIFSCCRWKYCIFCLFNSNFCGASCEIRRLLSPKTRRVRRWIYKRDLLYLLQSDCEFGAQLFPLLLIVSQQFFDNLDSWQQSMSKYVKRHFKHINIEIISLLLAKNIFQGNMVLGPLWIYLAITRSFFTIASRVI